tara:strand:+ start:3282 stop:3872 length:591 start_codon:yes stop_codon:yes gene_type:complete
MHIERLFPTPVLVFNLNRQFTQDEHDVFLDNASSVTNSSFNHMSTNRNVLDDNRMSEIKLFVQQSIDKYKSNIMKIKTKSELYVTESWTVYLNNGQSVHSHNHANSIVSGVLYYNDAKISFVNDKRPFLWFDESEFNEFNSNEHIMNLSQGDLILFPSSLVHFVKPIEQEKTRMSLSFNTFVKGTISEVKTKSLKI